MDFDSEDMVRRPSVHKDAAEQQAEAGVAAVREWPYHRPQAATLLQAPAAQEAEWKLQSVPGTSTTVPAG